MSAPTPNCQTIPSSRRQAERPHKPKRPGPQPPFRFCNLPSEIRNKIYRLCLVDDVKIGIEEKEQDGFYDMDGYEMKGEDPYEYGEIGLVHTYNSWDGDKPIYMNLNLLFVDKTTYQEAATIFYGLNTFQFYYGCPWRVLETFLLRLRRPGLDCFRRHDLQFPSIERYVEGSSVKLRKPLSEVKFTITWMKSFPNLETLRLRVKDDIMSSDCNRIHWIARMLVKSRIVLDIGTALIWDVDRGEKNRLVRISAAAREVFRDCGWELLGEYEKIDEQHQFKNEVLWLGWLREDALRCDAWRRLA